MQRRPPDEDQHGRDDQHQHNRCGDHHRGRVAEMGDGDDKQRYAGDAAETRAVQREADRHAAPRVEPETERVGDHAEAHAGPAEREHAVGEIELPRLAHLAERDRGNRGGRGAGDQAIARAERPHGFGDKGDDQRAEQIEEGGGARDQRCGPAAGTMQFGEIDALAVEAERPAEGRDQEADGDDAPAFVAERAFVWCGKAG